MRRRLSRLPHCSPRARWQSVYEAVQAVAIDAYTAEIFTWSEAPTDQRPVSVRTDGVTVVYEHCHVDASFPLVVLRWRKRGDHWGVVRHVDWILPPTREYEYTAPGVTYINRLPDINGEKEPPNPLISQSISNHLSLRLMSGISDRDLSRSSQLPHNYNKESLNSSRTRSNSIDQNEL